MIKKIYYKNIEDVPKIINMLIAEGVSIWNIYNDKTNKEISYYYNEDVLNVNIGVK